ncbi:MAG: hypothetical protein AAGK21_13230 [Bacteroidota bacterium]
MLRLFLSLLVLLTVLPAAAQRVLLVTDQDRLTLQTIQTDLTDAQRQLVDAGQAVVVGRVGDDSWCIGCSLSLQADARRSAAGMRRAGREMARTAREMERAAREMERAGRDMRRTGTARERADGPGPSTCMALLFEAARNAGSERATNPEDALPLSRAECAAPLFFLSQVLRPGVTWNIAASFMRRSRLPAPQRR